MGKIKVIIKRPDEEIGHMTHISNTLANFQNTVGGYIEVVPLDKENIILCNEEGKIKGLDFNMAFRGDFLVGTIIVCGIKGEFFKDINLTFEEWKNIVREEE